MNNSLSYAIGFAVSNIIWSIETMGRFDNYFSTFTLSVSLIMLLLVSLDEKQKKVRK